jgi:ABC-type multidrug transport system ATPase subunit
MHNQKVSSLSGGERNRLAIARFLLEEANLLLLDEPTNDLDLLTLAVLEQALLDFKGCVLTVSHDRYFLDRIATKILLFTSTGPTGPVLHWGSYTEVRERLARQATPAEARATPEPDTARRRDKTVRAEQREAERQQKRQRERDERHFVELEERITDLEAGIVALEETLARGGDDWEQLQRHADERHRLERDLEQTLAEWEALGLALETD